MKSKGIQLFRGIFVLSVAALLVACLPSVNPAPAITEGLLTVAVPTATAEPQPTATASGPTYQVIYDFQELHCQAKWTNNGQQLPCPSNLYEDNLSGSVSIANESNMENIILEGDSALLLVPAHDGQFRGIFGEYPPIMLQEGDEFRATIGCLGLTTPGDECDVEYSLEYIDEQGNYVDSQVTGWHWNETNDGEIHEIMVPFTGFGGRTLRFVLVVRDNGDPTDDTALWLHPQLWRVVTP